MFKVEVAARLDRAVLHFAYAGAVLRVNSLIQELKGRRHARVVSCDSKRLLRPEQLSGGNIPSETPVWLSLCASAS
jgi:hypothetical protein